MLNKYQIGANLETKAICEVENWIEGGFIFCRAYAGAK
jgi:hypothetical protein